MAKKTTSKSAKSAKGTTKKAPAKKAAAKKSSAKKASAKKAPAKKAAPKAAGSEEAATTTAPAKKPTSKKAASKKSAPKKAPVKKAAAEKAPAKKPTAKKAPTNKSSATKAASKKAPVTKKIAAKKAPAKKPVAKKTPAKPAAKQTEAQAAAETKAGPKGITVVAKKVSRRVRVKVEIPKFVPPGGPLLGPGLKRRAPLIASGPKNTVAEEALVLEAAGDKPRKSPFNKRQLDKYKAILLDKRRVLVGELDNLEFQALKSESGSLSNLPQHSAEQGSDTTEQSISLGMADADRQLIREIDAALKRIQVGTFGLCEQTGQPISEDRLEELPWAKLSIEAARASDRGFRR